MNILIVVPWIPYPPSDGGKVRSYYLIREASKRHTVSLFCIKNPSEDIHGLEELKRWCQRIDWVPSTINYSVLSKCRSIFSSLPFGLMSSDGDLERRLLHFCEGDEFDLVHLQGIEFSRYLRSLGKGRLILLDLVDCNSLHLLRRAQRIRDPVRRLWCMLQYKKFRRTEKRLLSTPLTVLLTSYLDLQFLLQGPRHPNFRALVLPNGVDVDAPLYRPQTAEPWTLVFTGNMSYYPNDDAVRFFCRKILPLIQKKLPQARLDVLGKNPSPDLVQFAKRIGNVSVTGFVNNLKAEMLKRCVYVCPLRIGTGLKVKLLEAMSVGMPIIATAVSTEGLDVENGKHLLIASSADEFAEKVLSVLSSSDLRRNLGTQARMKIEEKYTWKKIGQELYSIYDKVASDYFPFS